MFWLRNKNNNFQLHTLIWKSWGGGGGGGKQIKSWCQYGDLSPRVKLENNAVEFKILDAIPPKIVIFL